MSAAAPSESRVLRHLPYNLERGQRPRDTVAAIIIEAAPALRACAACDRARSIGSSDRTKRGSDRTTRL